MIGSCLCEQVHFEVRGHLPDFYQCHCSKCRKVTGSSKNTGTLVENSHFSWLSGEPLVRLYVKDTGYHSAFCSCCGSVMPNPLRDGSGYWIPAGALDEDQSEDAQQVAVHLCVADKAIWDEAGKTPKQYRNCPDIRQLRDDLSK